MTITINSLTISGSEITIGYDKQSQSDLTGKGYFYRIAGNTNSYKPVNNQNPSYVIDFWGNNLIDDTYKGTPYYNYPYTSTQLANKNLLDVTNSIINDKAKCLYCVGGEDGYNPVNILKSFNSQPGKRLLDIYDGIVLDIEMVKGVNTYIDLWNNTKSICDKWQSKDIVFCVAGTGYSPYNYNTPHGTITDDKNKMLNNLIEPMYKYISNNKSAYLAPMLYTKVVTHKGDQFSDNVTKDVKKLYDTYGMQKSLIPIYFNTAYERNDIADEWNISNYDNYMIWDSKPSNANTFQYFVKGCPYDFNQVGCIYKGNGVGSPMSCDQCHPDTGCDTFNDIGGNTCKIGYKATCSKSTTFINYKVVSGDSCTDIANKHKVKLKNLKHVNSSSHQFDGECSAGKSSNIGVGNTIIIEPNDFNGVSFTVKSGDTCDSLKAKYKTNIDNIYTINTRKSISSICSPLPMNEPLYTCPTPTPPEINQWKCESDTQNAVCKKCGNSTGTDCFYKTKAECNPACAKKDVKYSCSFAPENPVCIIDPTAWSNKEQCEAVCHY